MVCIWNVPEKVHMLKALFPAGGTTRSGENDLIE
jgi:hypothetical protein